MFRAYGIIGALMILLVEFSFFSDISLISRIYFPIVWFGYIFFIDAIIYKLKGSSLISKRPWQFIGLVLVSALFWDLFEFINYAVNNWTYVGGDFWTSFAARRLYHTLSFSTVLPAIFETFELVRALHLFDHIKLKHRYRISHKTLRFLIELGIIMMIAPLLLPNFFYPFIWIGLFLIFDPINYLHKQPSIIKHLHDRKLAIPLSLLAAGIICGFLWEFWNYWAPNKWTYQIPFLGFFKIFEMPILGYLGYFPFALELYAMYFFIRSLIYHKEKPLVA